MTVWVQLQQFRKKKTKSGPARTAEGGDESDASFAARTAVGGDESDTSFAGTVSGGDEDDLQDSRLKVPLADYL